MSDQPDPLPLPDERKLIENRSPPEKLADIDWAASTTIDAIERAKVNEIAGLLWWSEGETEEEKSAKLVKAIDLFDSVRPADGLESMLAAQMVGAHAAAMECMRRAMVPGQSFEGRNINLGHAQRMMALYAQQVAALDKHRGKGQQKVTVEHVHVAAGGQAIVGNVQGAPPPQSDHRTMPAPTFALEAPAPPLPSDFTTKRVRSPVARQK